jgi:adapter protein MecA 1/2
MKIERINENKIKVTISINDLEERNIDMNSINYNSPAAQELFWDMMEQAEVEFGFDVAESQLVIEPNSDSDDGFVITITKMDEEGDFESIQKYIKSRYRNTDIRVKKKSRKVYSTLLIYCFNNFDDLVALSQKIDKIYCGDSSLYEYCGTYYLILTRSNLVVPNVKAFEAILGEFGKKVSNTNFYEGYLSEYGETIIEYDAIATLNKHFNK